MKIPVPLSFLLVFTIDVLAGGLTMIELPCPICGGTGFLEGAPDLKVESVESKLIGMKHSSVISCDIVTITDDFKYEVNILLTNEGTEPSKGTIAVLFYPIISQDKWRVAFGTSDTLLIEKEASERGDAIPEQLHDPEEKIPTVIPIYVEVPPGTTKDIKQVLSFKLETESLVKGMVKSHRVEAARLFEAIPCTQCRVMKENGKMPFVEWLLLRITPQ